MNKEKCHGCEDMFDKDDLHYDDFGNDYCESCQDDNLGSWDERESDKKADLDIKGF